MPVNQPVTKVQPTDGHKNGRLAPPIQAHMKELVLNLVSISHCDGEEGFAHSVLLDNLTDDFHCGIAEEELSRHLCKRIGIIDVDVMLTTYAKNSGSAVEEFVIGEVESEYATERLPIPLTMRAESDSNVNLSIGQKG